MKRTTAIILIVCIMLCALTGCGEKPSINYDAKTQTVYVKGMETTISPWKSKMTQTENTPVQRDSPSHEPVWVIASLKQS